MTAIFALNLACAILIVCWPSKTWDARGMIGGGE